MLLKKKIFLLFFFILFALSLFAQKNDLTSVDGLPTKEVYDLLVDKKGFLWIAHDLGVSKYDGVSFTHYHCPGQMALSMTDLSEDNFGKIWCHNFNGQIFYVLNDQLHLLNSYSPNKEGQFPRIGLLGDELIATSAKGAFICNTQDLTYKYLRGGTGTTSLAILNGEAILYGHDKWFSYKKGGALKPLYSSRVAFRNTAYLHPQAYRDTLFISSTLLGYFHKLVIRGDSVLFTKVEKAPYFVNTLSLHNNNLWVNTKTDSYTLDRKARIKGLDLTDIVTDQEGNIWYSSLQNGLMVRYINDAFVKYKFLQLGKSDFVRSMASFAGVLACGTQNGEVILYDTVKRKVLFRNKLSLPGGSIEKINCYTGGAFLISASVGTWLLNINDKKLKIVNEKVLKDYDLFDHTLFSATSEQLTITSTDSRKGSINEFIHDTFPWLHSMRQEQNQVTLVQQRCRSVKYDSVNRVLYAALSKGLHIIDKDGIKQVFYEGRVINSSALAFACGEIYVGDFNRGLLIIHGKQIKAVSIADGLLSNTILKLKAYGDHLYITSEKGMQLYDARLRHFIKDIRLPTFEQGILYDVVESNRTALISTSEGVYRVALGKKGKRKTFENYLKYIIINNRDTVTSFSHELSYDSNNITFQLAVPAYSNAHRIFFRYRLEDGGNRGWNLSAAGERNLQYAALMPGKYTFEAIAITADGNQAARHIKINFIISKPWWLRAWFAVAISLLVCAVIAVSIRSYYRKKLKEEQDNHEKKIAIEIERYRIGAEIHDDIGAGLSALRLYTGLVKEKIEDPKLKTDVSRIYGLVTELSTQIREVIWTLDPAHDSLENLLYYLRQQTVNLFEQTDILLKFHLPEKIRDYKIGGEKRRNIYLLVKEACHNAIKHSKATEVLVNIRSEENLLWIYVSDNGIGFQETPNRESRGFINMNRRIKTINGRLDIRSGNGTELEFWIPV